MSERKVLVKHISPEFDPSIKLRAGGKKGAGRPTRFHIRMMTPFQCRCLHCAHTMVRGTKFNMDMEKVPDLTYLGVPVYRFFFKCPSCYNRLVFRTDPKLGDYIPEAGLKAVVTLTRMKMEERMEREYEGDVLEGVGVQRRDPKTGAILKDDDEDAKSKLAGAPLDALESLEVRTSENKQRMERMAMVEQIRLRNERNEEFDPDDLLALITASAKDEEAEESGEGAEKLTEEDEKEIAAVFAKPATSDGVVIHRISHDPSVQAELLRGSLPSTAPAPSGTTPSTVTAATADDDDDDEPDSFLGRAPLPLPTVRVSAVSGAKRPRAPSDHPPPSAPPQKTPKEDERRAGGAAALGAYGSDSDD